MYDDFRYTAKRRYGSSDTDLFASILLLGIAELVPITAPDKDREHLVRVGLIQIYECWLNLAAGGLVDAGSRSAHCRKLTDVCRCFPGVSFC